MNTDFASQLKTASSAHARGGENLDNFFANHAESIDMGEITTCVARQLSPPQLKLDLFLLFCFYWPNYPLWPYY